MTFTPISEARQLAQAVYQVEWLTVDDHVSTTVDTSGAWFAKPREHQGFYFATCIRLQALGQNVRYTIDTIPATPTRGFQLAAGQITTIPVPNEGISIASETAVATLQYQWIR